MAHPFGISHDIRANIQALCARREVERQLEQRSDLIGCGERLIRIMRTKDAEEQRRLAAEMLKELTGRLPAPEELALCLAKFSEIDRDSRARGLAVPAGVRHPLLQFSAVLQLKALLSDDRTVAGIPIMALPLTSDDLAHYLYRSMALPQPHIEPADFDGTTPDVHEGDLSCGVASAFSRKFGFELEALAERLVPLIDDDPDLYLLILSREVGLYANRANRLEGFAVAAKTAGDGTQKRHVAARASPSKRVCLTNALQLAWELQRAAIMTWSLLKWRNVTLFAMQDLTAGDERNVHQRLVNALSKRGPEAKVLEPILVQAASLRRYLRHHKDWQAIKDLNGVLGALKSGRADWWSPAFIAGDEGFAALRRGLEDLKGSLKRRRGKGFGWHDDRLDIFCGIPADELPFLAMLDLGKQMTGQVFQDELEQLAMAMLRELSPAVVVGRAEHLRRQAQWHSSTYLPRSGWGAAGRLDLRHWSDRHADEGLYRQISKHVQHASRGDHSRRTDEARIFHLALQLLTRRFRNVYRRSRAGPLHFELVADLATSVCALTTDPMFHAILQRQSPRCK